MNRTQFMDDLENLLLDIQENEREEALQYYTDYFEEAGPENEQQVLMELGTPEKVAAIIKTSLLESSSESGEFSETGYADPRFTIHYEVGSHSGIGEESQEGVGTEQKKTAYRERTYKQEQSAGNIALIVLLCILAIPVGLPVLGGVFGIIVGILAGGFGLFVAVAALAAGLSIAGACMVVAGIIELFTTPAVGLLVCGAGLVLLGIGVLCILLTVLICGKFLPWLLRAIVSLCRAPFNRRGRMV